MPPAGKRTTLYWGPDLWDRRAKRKPTTAERRTADEMVLIAMLMVTVTMTMGALVGWVVRGMMTKSAAERAITEVEFNAEREKTMLPDQPCYAIFGGFKGSVVVATWHECAGICSGMDPRWCHHRFCQNRFEALSFLQKQPEPVRECQHYAVVGGLGGRLSVTDDWEYTMELMRMDPRSTRKEFWSHWEAVEWLRTESAIRTLQPRVHIAILRGKGWTPLIVRSWRECHLHCMRHAKTVQYRGFDRRLDAERWLDTKTRRGGA